MEQRRKALIRLLRDDSEDVRASAAAALERLEGLSNLAALTERYRSGDKPITVFWQLQNALPEALRKRLMLTARPGTD